VLRANFQARQRPGNVSIEAGFKDAPYLSDSRRLVHPHAGKIRLAI
jgi:hypothetical protein